MDNIVDEDNLRECIDEYDLNELFPKNILYPGQQVSSNNNIDMMSGSGLRSGSSGANISVQLKSNPIIVKNNIKKSVVNDIYLLGNYLFVVVLNELKVFQLDVNKKFEILAQNTYYFEEDEELMCLDYTEMHERCFIAVGGTSSIIKIMDLNAQSKKTDLIGHRDTIFDLKFRPTSNNLLLSGSADFSIRLWDINNGNQLVIFGGDRSHLAQVLSISWHGSGNYFVTAGIDRKVILWEVNKDINNKINESLKNKKPKTLLVNDPLYSCKDIHKTIIDDVKFNGNLILAKGSDGLVKEFTPVFSDGNQVLLINTYEYQKDVLCHGNRMYLDNNLLFVGDNKGICYIFTLNTPKGDDLYFKNQPICKIITNEPSNVRCISYCNKNLAVGLDNGSIYLYKLNITNNN
jgi:WD40 repeat protein